MDIWDLLKFESVLADPTGYPIPKSEDERRTLMMGVAETFADEPNRRRWENAIAVYHRMAKAGYAADALDAIRVTLRNRPADAPEVNEDLAVFAPAVRAAGLTRR